MAGDLIIHQLGPKGDGIHDSARGRIYVDRTLPGDSVQAKIRRGDDGIIRGDLVEVVKHSPHRVAAPCPYYDVCGGCTMQHAEDGFYRDWKVEIVRDALEKKGVRPRIWLDPVFLPAGNRRRATFAAYKKNNIVTLGYYKRRTHSVTPIDACLVADPAIMGLRNKLVMLLVPILQEGKAADVFIQFVNGQFDIIITGPVGKKGKPDLPLREAIAQMAHTSRINRIGWRARDRDPIEVMIEREPIRIRFGALDVKLPPMAFLQPTRAGEKALTDAVMELLPEKGRFADLFCGCGTFSGPMLERGQVDAFDSVGPAITALEKAAGGKPLKALRRDLFKNPLRRDEANKYDAIVFDPPRAGAQEQSRNLASGKTPVLIGVSCNPATFARDARTIIDGGYRLESVRIIDQFTWSHHVELVALFTKR